MFKVLRGNYLQPRILHAVKIIIISQGRIEREGSTQGNCMKDLWTKTALGRIESGRWGMGRAGESTGGGRNGDNCN